MAFNDRVAPVSRRGFLAGAAGLAGAIGVAGCASPVSVRTSSELPAGSGPASSAELAELELEPTRGWYIGERKQAPVTLISGYSGRDSVLAGEAVPLFVNTVADTWTAQVYRIGHYEGLGGALVAGAGPFKGQRQPGPRFDSKSRMVDAPWEKSAELDTAGWPAGQYVIHVTANRLSSFVPLTVRSADIKGKVVVVNSATTLAAYNIWGGRNLYGDRAKDIAARSYAVSLDRPIDPGWVLFLLNYEIPLARVAESAGVPLAWVSNIDISQNPELLDGALGLVSPGHDEYWTIGYRQAMESLRAAGGNLAYTGANAGYWRVRLAETQNGPARRVVCYKSAALDPRHGSADTTARWRDAPFSRPENQIVGQLYDAFPVEASLKIRDPDFFLFAGTEVREAELFPHLIGSEIDRFYPNSDTPRPIQLPAISPATCRGKSTWSTMSYYTVKSGAGVFASGTMNWTRALPLGERTSLLTQRTKEFAETVTRNLIAAMGKGPMGNAHPARDDSDAVNFPDYNTSGAA